MEELLTQGQTPRKWVRPRRNTTQEVETSPNALQSVLQRSETSLVSCVEQLTANQILAPKRAFYEDASPERQSVGEAPQENDRDNLHLIQVSKASADSEHLTRLAKSTKSKQDSYLIAKWGLENLCEKIIQNNSEEPLTTAIKSQIKCGDWLSFRKPEGDDWKLYAGNFCSQHLTCPACASARAMKILANYLTKIVTILTEYKTTVKLYFVTLTVKNQSNISTTFKQLHAGLKKLNDYARKTRNKNCRQDKLSNLIGTLGQIETKRGKGGEWHPHYHAIWAVENNSNNKPLDYKEVNRTWQRITGAKVTYCRKLHSEILREKNILGENHAEQLLFDSLEVIKYPIKFPELNDPQNIRDIFTISGALKGKRLLRTTGIFRGIQEPENLDDGPVDWDRVAFLERIWRYNYKQSQYQEDTKKFKFHEGETLHV